MSLVHMKPIWILFLWGC